MTTKKTQHTGGPWAVVVESERRLEPAVMAGPEFYVATCHDFGDGGAQALTNARLIAQAPAMADFIRRILPHFARADWPGSLGNEARAILAAIEGDQ